MREIQKEERCYSRKGEGGEKLKRDDMGIGLEESEDIGREWVKEGGREEGGLKRVGENGLMKERGKEDRGYAKGVKKTEYRDLINIDEPAPC